ncbi:type II secretion system F family protein [Paenibacillus woosongensis]|uniref:Type II secretion system protein GspF domain-containing protein n=1 Tax=Paenibacillus woosongensis TaxID=307580 RepID=A0ABQ4MYX6_9BACL|nr:hypothetical protein [Paenibacillus woosongensis]GIP61131.1 hypothetical protein J15TS10_49450 [Paenibacillus woosongensis]
MIWLYLLSGFVVAIALVSCLPQVTHHNRGRRLRLAFGFEQTQAAAEDIGIHLNWKHYLGLITFAFSIGVGIAILTKNVLFIILGIGISFVAPKIMISQVKYQRRKEMLLNLPGNLRLLTSKLRDCKSLQKALEMSIPLMQGITAETFERAHKSLQLGVDVSTVVMRMKKEIRFKQFDDYCEKLLMGSRDGFHSRVIDGTRETIDDIYDDMQLLQKMDIKNKRKRLEAYLIFGLCFTFPYLFRYMESEMAKEIGQVITLDTLIGQLLIVSMAFVSLLGIWKRDTYLRLNLDDL